MRKLFASVSRIFNYSFAAFLVTFMTTSVALADAGAAGASGVADGSMDIRKVFRHQLLASIGDAFLNNGILDWSGNSLLHYFFATATAIAIFQVFYRHYGTNGFLLEWAKIPFFALVAMSILGGWDGYQSIFSYVPSGIHQGVRTLDKDVYYYLADQFDTLAGELDKVGGPDIYAAESAKLFTALSKIQTAVLECKVMGDTNCIYEKIQNIQQENNPPTTAQNADPGVMDTVKLMAKKVIGFIETFEAPLPFWILQVVVWVLELVRMFINYFTLIVFALITAMGLFFCKIFTVFLVLPEFRGRIWTAYKMPLSASMYGFLTSLIISCSTVIIRGINEATISSLSQQALSAHGLTTVDLMNVLFGSALATSAILFVQILSMSKVPGLCRSLWDLSLEELVNFGKTIIEAGLGAVKAVGGLALGVGAIGAVGAASAMGAAANGAGAMGSMKAGLSGLGRGARAVGGGGMPQGGLQGLLGLKSDGSSGGGGSGGPSSSGFPGAPFVGSGGGGGSSGGGGGASSSDGGMGGVLGTGSGASSSGGAANAGRIGLKGKTASESAAAEDSAEVDSSPTKKAKAEKPEFMSDGITEKPKTLAEAKSAKRWAMANHAFKGASAIARGLGGLAGAGIGAAFGQDHGVVNQLVGHGNAATMGIGKVQEAHAEHTAVREEIIDNNIASFGDNHTKSMSGFDVDHEKAGALVEKFRSGETTDSDYAELSKTIHNGDMSKLHGENGKLHTSLMGLKETGAFKEFEESRNSRIKDAANRSVTKNLRGKVTGLNHEKFEDFNSLMEQGLVNRSNRQDFKPVREGHSAHFKETKSRFASQYNENPGVVNEFAKAHEEEQAAHASQQQSASNDYVKETMAAQTEKNTIILHPKAAPAPVSPDTQSENTTTSVMPVTPSMGVMNRPKMSITNLNDDLIQRMNILRETDTYKKLTPDQQREAQNHLMDELNKKK